MYAFKILNCFKKQFKAYCKEFPSLTTDVISTLWSFRKENATSFSTNNYKIRIRSSNLSKGKNKSFGLILYVIEVQKLILPIALYFKSEKANMTKTEINVYLRATIEN